MEYRNLGTAGVKVSPLWLGTAYFNTRISEETATELIHAALGAGINVIDTANAYSEPRGYAETIVGKAIKDRRDQVVLATKVFHPMGDGPNDRGTSRYHIMEQVHASLRRLNTERIDLYQLHRPDPETPIEETLRTLEDLRRQGKDSLLRHFQVCRLATSAKPFGHPIGWASPLSSRSSLNTAWSTGPSRRRCCR